jgi:uncharacterized SAM-binding protein YcdF (DUF218 family)
MFFVLSKILDVVISPLVWIIILAFWAILIFSKNREKARKLLLISVLSLFFFSNPFIANALMKWWEQPAINANTIQRPYDVGIVLGGSMRFYDKQTNRVVYSSSVDRLIQALQLYHDKKINKILLSGGSGFVNFQEWKESGLLAEVLLKSGVKPEDILLENNSRNTAENAMMSANILKKQFPNGRFLLITSAFHMKRSLLCFNKAELPVDAFPVDVRSGGEIYTVDRLIQPDAENISTWDIIIHEWVGILMYKLMGYI